MQNEKTFKNLQNLYKSGALLMIILSIVGILYAVNLFREGKLIGSNAQNSIVVTGTGKVTAKPDIANITFTALEQTKDNKEGQDKVAEKVKKALAEIKKIVDEKDIKTERYASVPRYSYPANGQPRIEGYDVTQTVSIKVRNTENVSKILDIISTSGINQVSGPDYTIDNSDKYKQEAREMAIKEAKEKAEKLASQLGVNLSRIISFSENEGYAQPTYYNYTKAESTRSDVAPAPQLPAGENEIVSNISITFEIK